MPERVVAIHQPNFVPWLPFFHKMDKADVFVLLTQVQFEKNGYQNRYSYQNRWITKPVKRGKELIHDKVYTSGQSLPQVNELWIRAIAKTLDIDTEITYEFPLFNQKIIWQDPTAHLLKIIREVDGTTYLTNPEAKNKYLDEDLLKKNGIKIQYLKTPKDMQIHTFEAFEKWGIEGTIKQLRRG